jgi:hypothetical protein
MSEPREDPEPQNPDTKTDAPTGPVGEEPSGQEHHNPETEEDTASGGPA